MITEISECGLCKSNFLTEVLNFGESPLANNLKQTPSEAEFTSPLVVAKCEECGCFQLKHLVDGNILFGGNYNYKSSKGLESHFQQYAESVVEYLKLEKGSLAVGIGGNIGLLETSLNGLGLTAVNIEPAKNIAMESEKNGIITINNFFNRETAKNIRQSLSKAKLITANNVLAHCPMQPIIEGVDEVLAEDGYLVMENAYWLDSVKNLDFAQVYVEHERLYTISPLCKYFDSHGYDLFRVERNNIQCGSFRAFVKRKSNTKFDVHPSVQACIDLEEKAGLYDLETYKDLNTKLQTLKSEIVAILDDIRNKGQRVGIYGVPAKIVLILKYFGLSDYFCIATDDSELKHDKYIPGTEIKIVNKTRFFAHKLDYVFIGAYNFKDLVIKNNPEFAGKWMNILPKLEII